jgi:hypothetical protein
VPGIAGDGGATGQLLDVLGVHLEPGISSETTSTALEIDMQTELLLRRISRNRRNP